jgi:filamentous hemagglutinin family protein
MSKDDRQGDLRIQGIILGTLLVAAGADAAAPKGIRLDGSIGAPAQVLPGPIYNITQGLGKLAGDNLFFSFQYFNVGTGETALYTTTSPGINNVISRVTGGYTSTIDGTISLHAASGDPNFFFINPAGVTFTANASVNVPAAFHVTTADYLKFSDGNFYSDPSRRSRLSAASPEAFGFLGATRSPVDILGAGLYAGLGGDGEFQIVAGDVTTDGLGTGGGVLNTSGAVRVVVVGAAATEVPLAGFFASKDGTITIQNGGVISASSIGTGTATGNAGQVTVTAGSILIDGGSVVASEHGTGILSESNSGGPAGDVDVTTGGALTIINGGQISAGTRGFGNGGSVAVSAGSVAITGTGNSSTTSFTGINTQTTGSGSAGPVYLMTPGSLTIRNGAISASTDGSGNGGELDVKAGSIAISGTGSPSASSITGIASEASEGSTGSAGSVVVNTPGVLSIANGGQISAGTLGAGKGGSVAVSAGSIAITGGGVASAGIATGITSQAGFSEDGQAFGSPGSVVVNTTGVLSIANGGLISAANFGAFNGGSVAVSAGSVAITGTGNSSTTSFTGINTQTGGFGSAGSVYLMTPGSLTINNGAISTSTGGVVTGESLTLKPALSRLVVLVVHQFSSRGSPVRRQRAPPVPPGRWL